ADADRSFLALVLGFALLSSLLASDPVGLVLLTLRLLHGHAIETHWTSDVHALSLVPGVIALGAIERPLTGTEDVKRLRFVEHVLIEHLAIDVAPREHFFHERVEVALRRGFRLTRRCFGRCLSDRETGARSKEE